MLSFIKDFKMSNSNFSVIDISSIKQIKPNQWNSLVSGSNSSVFHTWEWFNAYENVYPNGALKEVHHIVVYSHKGNILAILPLLHIKRDPLWLAIATNYNVAEMEILNLDCLLSHSWYSFYSRILSIDSSLTYLSDIEKKIAQICEFNSIPYCCFSSVEINDPLYARLINQGHKPYSIIFNNRLGPLPSDFNQYIKFISSSNIRRNLIRYKNRLKNFGIKEEWIQSPSDNVINEFYLLISAACKRLNDPEC